MAGKKLLVVDDSLTIQKVIRLALSNEGYEIQACSDGAEAIQQIALFRPDVILVDVTLPGKTAFEIKAEINTDPDLTEIRFVLMSSAFEQVDESGAEKVGFHARLIKPFDPAHLRQVLIDVLATVKPATPNKALRQKALEVEQETTPSLVLKDDIWGSGEMKSDPVIADPAPSRKSEPAPPPAHFDSLAAAEPDGTFPMRMSKDETGDTDIRRLTEATIKMSGLDDFHWSVSDSGKKQLAPEEPALKPHSNLADFGNSSFKFDPEEPPVELHGTYGNLPLTPPPAKEKVSHPAGAGAQVAPVSSTDVEDAVKRHLENTLEIMAQKMLPEIAERVIKKEIHRLLSEIP